MQSTFPADSSSDLALTLRDLDPPSRVNAAAALDALPLLHGVCATPLFDPWAPERGAALVQGAVKSVLKNFVAAIFAVPGSVTTGAWMGEGGGLFLCVCSACDDCAACGRNTDSPPRFGPSLSFRSRGPPAPRRRLRRL